MPSSIFALLGTFTQSTLLTHSLSHPNNIQYAVRWFVDPRQVFCLISIAIRIAQRMGLHRDPAGSGIPPFEVEQRRRLWWTIVGYDRRIGEMTGSTVTALSSGGDTKVPLNVNDSDLHVDGEELPKPHAGPTEMLFALTRVEIAMAVASNSNRDSHKMNNPERDKPSPGGSGGLRREAIKQPDVTIKLAGQDGPAYSLDGFCAHIEGTYLAHCDPKIPLHFYTLTLTRQTLCKMQVVQFLVRMHDSEVTPLREVERDNLFIQATQMIEYDNVVQSSESLKRFRWYSMHHFPFPAYMFLVQELRHRKTGMLVERAWDAIALNHDLRTYLNYLHSPMHKAFGNLFLKAWNIHESAQLRAGKPVTVPRFIVILRERADERRRARMENQEQRLGTASPYGVCGTRTSERATSDAAGASAMMTPPSIDQAIGAAGSAPAGASAGVALTSAPVEEQGMDWSYLAPGYQDPSVVSGVNSFGPFGVMGGVPGMENMGGLPGGRNMF